MRKIMVAFFVGTLALASFGRVCLAQDSAKEQDVRRLLEVSGSAKMGVQVMEQMTKMFRQQLPQVPGEFWDEFVKEVKADDMVNMIVPIYSKHFSHDEIKQLIAFYESPVGKRLVAEQPGIAAESMQVGQQWGQQIAGKAMERLKDKGFLPKK